MTADVSAVAAPLPAASSTAVPALASSDQRWDAWLAKGAAHDRAVGRKMRVAAAILIPAIGVVLYAFFGR